jgi:hypothetical protein
MISQYPKEIFVADPFVLIVRKRISADKFVPTFSDNFENRHVAGQARYIYQSTPIKKKKQYMFRSCLTKVGTMYY